jgi:hypothetical protein
MSVLHSENVNPRRRRRRKEKNGKWKCLDKMNEGRSWRETWNYLYKEERVSFDQMNRLFFLLRTNYYIN